MRMCEPLMLLKAWIYDLQKIRFASITSYGLRNINNKALLELALTVQHKKASRNALKYGFSPSFYAKVVAPHGTDCSYRLENAAVRHNWRVFALTYDRRSIFFRYLFAVNLLYLWGFIVSRHRKMNVFGVVKGGEECFDYIKNNKNGFWQTSSEAP